MRDLLLAMPCDDFAECWVVRLFWELGAHLFCGACMFVGWFVGLFVGWLVRGQLS